MDKKEDIKKYKKELRIKRNLMLSQRKTNGYTKCNNVLNLNERQCKLYNSILKYFDVQDTKHIIKNMVEKVGLNHWQISKILGIKSDIILKSIITNTIQYPYIDIYANNIEIDEVDDSYLDDPTLEI